ncbi:DNA repair protein RecO, partial [Candidatus Bipolaricaulota bacterium]|nr:DNA repair protein RecO [Candidatus Bipolaricaulota bacterium]
MGLQRGEGIVLRVKPFRESDLIVSLFTAQWGVRHQISKGARGARSRSGAALDFLNDIEVIFYEKSGLDLVSQASIIDAHHKLKADYDTTMRALAAVKLTEKLLALHQPEPRVLETIRAFLRKLDEDGAEAESLWLATMLKVISLLGHRPSLLQCGRCGGTTSELTFLPESGGVLCHRCRRSQRGIALNLGAARSLDRLLEQPLE